MDVILIMLGIIFGVGLLTMIGCFFYYYEEDKKIYIISEIMYGGQLFDRIITQQVCLFFIFLYITSPLMKRMFVKLSKFF